MVGTTGPFGSGLPQLGLPRLFAIDSLCEISNQSFSVMFPFYRKLLFATLSQDWFPISADPTYASALEPLEQFQGVAMPPGTTELRHRKLYGSSKRITHFARQSI
jgi:hypothetical protein